MPVLPRNSKVEPIQSLLIQIQKNFPQLPIEYQNLAAIELERVANLLKRWIEEGSNPREHDDSARSNIDAEPKQQSQSWLGLALEQSHSGAWSWDLIRGTAQWSPELCSLFGIDPVQEISDPKFFFEMIHPDDRALVSNQVNEVIKRGGPFYLEFRLLDRSGNTRWVSSAGTVEYDPLGRPIQASGINQDITARKLTENALQESVAREQARAAELQALMDAVPAMIWISRDPQCKEMVGNRYGYEFLNMWEGANISKTAPDMDLVQQTYRNLKNGQEIPSDELPMQIAASTGEGTSNYEFDLVFINGVTRNLLGNVVPLTDPNGLPSGAVGAFVDITERKRIENELRRSESQLQMWKEYISFWNKATNSFFWLLEPDGSYQNPILTNPGISGRFLDQTRGWNWIEIIHPEDQDHLRNRWRGAIEHQSAFEVEARVWHEASQQYRWFSHRAVPILEQGVLKGWIGASIDIQPQKESELALRESEHRFRIALASAPMTVFTTDKELRYTWIYNPQHNFTPGQMVGKRDDEILVPEDATELIQLKQSVIETGQPVRQEIKVKVNGTWLYFVVSFDPVFDSGGCVTGLICAAFDITAQRTLEMIQRENEIRMATQQRLMETRENERIKIAREIHDGPLQTFMGMTFDLYNVKEEVADQTIKLKLGALESGLRSGLKELRQSINELRQHALMNIKLTEAIEERISAVREKLPELKLSVDLDEAANSLPEELILTLYRISQESLQNMIRHSKATRAGLHLRMENHGVTLIVEDNGKGFLIADDFAALMAEKHYGLAGMKERAEAVGGTLQVSSAHGKGTKIKVDIPV